MGSYLRVTASYTDGEGSGKGAQTVSDHPVHASPDSTPPCQPQVIPVPGAVVVCPDRESRITSPDGSVTLIFPTNSRALVFQARLTVGQGACTSIGEPAGRIYECVSVEFFDASGNQERNVYLDKAALFTISVHELSEFALVIEPRPDPTPMPTLTLVPTATAPIDTPTSAQTPAVESGLSETNQGDGGFPWWAVVVIVVGTIAGAVLIVGVQRRWGWTSFLRGANSPRQQ